MANNRLNKICINSLSYNDYIMKDPDRTLDDGETIFLFKDKVSYMNGHLEPVLKIGTHMTVSSINKLIGFPISKIPIINPFNYDPTVSNNWQYAFDYKNNTDNVNVVLSPSTAGQHMYCYDAKDNRYVKFAYAGSLSDYGIFTKSEANGMNTFINRYLRFSLNINIHGYSTSIINCNVRDYINNGHLYFTSNNTYGLPYVSQETIKLYSLNSNETGATYELPIYLVPYETCFNTYQDDTNNSTYIDASTPLDRIEFWWAISDNDLSTSNGLSGWLKFYTLSKGISVPINGYSIMW